jgi:hypothetical protein
VKKSVRGELLERSSPLAPFKNLKKLILISNKMIES